MITVPTPRRDQVRPRNSSNRIVDFLPRCPDEVRIEPQDSALRFQVAQTIRERAQAFNLVYHSYLKSGLVHPNRSELYVNPYQLADSSTVFLCLGPRSIVGTVTLIGDSPAGLPMEEIYGDEVNRLRQQGIRFGEVSCLAFAKLPRRLFLDTFIQLTRLMSQFARHHGLHQLLMTAHPKHVQFYARNMGFHIIGGRRTYPRVRNKPAMAASLDFDLIDRERPWTWNAYFAEPIPGDQLQRHPMLQTEKNYYCRLLNLALPARRAPSVWAVSNDSTATPSLLSPAWVSAN